MVTVNLLLLVTAAAVLLFAAFVAGIAYTRRALRRNPEGFAENVLRAKDLTAETRARWQSIVGSFKS